MRARTQRSHSERSSSSQTRSLSDSWLMTLPHSSLLRAEKRFAMPFMRTLYPTSKKSTVSCTSIRPKKEHGNLSHKTSIPQRRENSPICVLPLSAPSMTSQARSGQTWISWLPKWLTLPLTPLKSSIPATSAASQVRWLRVPSITAAAS